jgi:exonuclease III
MFLIIAMKLVTWNVNGIRARQGQVQEFIEREQPESATLWLSNLGVL